MILQFKRLRSENVRPVMEYLGYSFYPSYEPIKAVMFIQSAEHLERYRIEFLDYLYSVLTNYNCLSTTCLAKGWNLYGLQERHINVFNDYTKPTVYRTDFLKPLTGAVSINAKTNSNKKFEYTNYAKLWFGTENIHQFLDASSEWSERLFALTIDYKISFKKFDAAKIKQERGAFAYKCILAAYEAFERGSLTVTPSIEARRKDWQTENDSVQAFLDENCVTGENYRVNRRDLYQAYENWCNFEHLHALMNKNFTKSMRDKGYEVKRLRDDANGKRFYFFLWD